MLLFSHPTGNANVRHAALALQEAGLLEAFWTTVSYRPDGLASKVLPGSLRQQLSRRSYPESLRAKIHSTPLREVGRMLCDRVGLGFLAKHETGPLCVDAVYQALDAAAAKQLRQDKIRAVYAYEDGAARSFEVARELGKTRLYDLPIGYWRAARRIMTEEALKHPEWAMTIGGNRDSDAKTARKDQELALAEHVFVASSFTKASLQEAPGFEAPVSVIPYGAPLPETLPALRKRTKGARLKLLYVGSLGQRKGLSYLFEAQEALGSQVELTVVGRKPSVECPALDRALGKVNWIPSCPHAQVLELMRAHDLFVFPSLFEGFGLVLLEAMAMGLPILTTPHTAGPDLLGPETRGGVLVPAGDSEALIETIGSLGANPERIEALSEEAALRARDFTWKAYESALAAQVATLLQCEPKHP